MLRLPRLTKVAAIIGLAPLLIALSGLPAYGDSVRQAQWWLAALHVPQAWPISEGTSVKVAVLADGVSAGQLDLAGSVVSGPAYLPGGAAAGAHDAMIGTGLASLIAGHGHGTGSADGITGVAPGARILSLRVIPSPDDPGWSDPKVATAIPGAMAAGIRYAVASGAAVIVLPADPGIATLVTGGHSAPVAGRLAVVQAAVADAERRDVVLVAPAGDNAGSGDSANYPAAYPGVLAVGAFGPGFAGASFSNRGSYVSLAAPGDGVVAATPAGYQTMRSTWAASAIAAGVAALIRSHFPSLTASQVVRSMTQGSGVRPASPGAAPGPGTGTVDALNALTVAATMSPPLARPAGFGARPLVAPDQPKRAAPSAGTTSDLLRDAAIAAGVLIFLLIPISTYAAVARRREQRAAQQAAQREARRRLAALSGTGGHSGTAGPDGEEISRRTGQRHARTAKADGPGGTASVRFQPAAQSPGTTVTDIDVFRPRVPLAPRAPVASRRREVTAAGQMQGDGAGRTERGRGVPPWQDQPMAAAPVSASAPASPAVPAVPADPGRDGGAGRNSRAGQRAETAPPPSHDPRRMVRRTPVSGRPPWEPATPPVTANPWVPVSPPQLPVPADTGTPSRVPPESIWETTLSLRPQAVPPAPAPPDSLFEPLSRQTVIPAAAGQRPAVTSPSGSQLPPPAVESPAADRRREDSGSYPIYVWNPPGASD